MSRLSQTGRSALVRMAWRGAALAAAFLVGAGFGRGFHPLFWARGGDPAFTPSEIQQFRRSAQLHDTVYFLGDSQVEGFATSELDAKTSNFGEAGDTVEHLTQRARHFNFTGARAVVLEIGVNDSSAGFKGFGAAYAGLLAAIPAKAPIIATAIAPVMQRWAYGDGSAENRQIAQANAVIAQTCAARPLCRFLQPWPTAPMPSALVETDGEHLSAAGYSVWRAALGSALR